MECGITSPFVVIQTYCSVNLNCWIIGDLYDENEQTILYILTTFLLYFYVMFLCGKKASYTY